MASRSEEKAQLAINELREETGKDAIFLQLDLSSLASVRRAAETFMRYIHFSLRKLKYRSLTRCSKETELHVLINNAYVPSSQAWSRNRWRIEVVV